MMPQARYISVIALLVAAIVATVLSVHGVLNGAALAITTILFVLLLTVVVFKLLAGEREARRLVDERTADLAARNLELSNTRQFESSVLDSLAEGVVACDADGVLVYANRAAYDTQGIAQDEPIERYLAERRLLDVDGRTPLSDDQAPLIRCLREGDMTDVRLKFVRGDGEVRDALCNARRVYDGAGVTTGAVSAFRDITELVELADDLQRERERLAHLADHDELTDLLNRRAFEDRLEEHLSLAERYGWSGALLMIDIDNLKNVNDRYGHAAGDALIVAAAESMRARLRESDLLFRVGGDEFAVLLPQADRAQAEIVADGILHCVSECRAQVRDGQFAGTTASVGIAVIADYDSPAKGTIKAAADAAMYRAKERGRNQCVFARADSPHWRAA